MSGSVLLLIYKYVSNNPVPEVLPVLKAVIIIIHFDVFTVVLYKCLLYTTGTADIELTLHALRGL